MRIFGKKKEKGSSLLPSTTTGRPITSSSSSLPSSDDDDFVPGKSGRINKNNSNGYEPPSSTTDSPSPISRFHNSGGSTVYEPLTSGGGGGGGGNDLVDVSVSNRASSVVSDLEGGDGCRYSDDDDDDVEPHLTIEPKICRRIENPYPMFGNNDNTNRDDADNNNKTTSPINSVSIIDQSPMNSNGVCINDDGGGNTNFACFEVDNGGGGTNFSCFEVEYDEERFHNIGSNKTKVFSAVSKRVTSFSHRVKSFRHDIRSQSRFDHKNQTKSTGGGRSRMRKNGSIEKIGQILLDTQEDDIEIMTLSSGDSTQSNSLEYYEADDTTTTDRHHRHHRHRYCGQQQHTATDDIDRMDCNEHARSQYKIWKRAAIEGPNYIRVVSFCLASLILLSVVYLIAVCFFPWTSSSIVSCFHLVVGATLILLFESRSSICLPFTCGGCCLFQNNIGTDNTNENEDKNVLPIDAYREYGENHPDALGAKSRDDVLQRLNVLRFLYGRGGLYAFTGSMTIAMIPISTTISNVVLSSNSDDTTADAVNINILIPLVLIYLLGILLLILGMFAFFAGVHAAFRWTLLDTSIHCNDEHLKEKFISAAATHQNNSSNISRDVETMRLDRHEFSILVMTLGLDLDEITMIPKVFIKEIQTKNSKCVTFNEFHSWWRGKKHTKSQRSIKPTTSVSSKNTNTNKNKNSPSSTRRGRAELP
jgi:hypothetical protein